MSIQAEMNIIGSVLKDNSCYDLIPTEFHYKDFVREDHQIIYRTMQSMLDTGKPVDIILLAEALETQRSLERIGGLEYLGTIIQSVYTTKNLNHHVLVVQKASVLRKLKASVSEINELCESHGDPVDIAIEAEKKITSILDSKQDSDYAHIGVAVAEAIDWESDERKSVRSGLRDLDSLVNGFTNGNLVILAARPSMGKSSLAMQIAESISKTEPAAIFTLEMTRREVAARMIKYHRLRLDSDIKVTDHLFSLNLQIDDTPGIGLGHVRTRCRRIKRKHGLSLLVIDYLQLMSGSGENRNQEIGSLSRGLKSIAKEFDIPVVVLSQLSRKVEERADRRPIMSDLRESGEIEQDADVILFIYRDEVYNPSSAAKGTAEIICRKNRNGPTGTARLTFDGSVTRFGNYDGEEIYDSCSEPQKKSPGRFYL